MIQTQTTILEGGMGSQVSGHPQPGFATLGSFDLEMSRQGSNQGSQGSQDQDIMAQENILLEENLDEGTFVASSVIEDNDY